MRQRYVFNGFMLLLGLGLFLIFLTQSNTNYPHDLLINLKAIQSYRQTGVLYSWTPSSPQALYYSFISSPTLAIILYPLTIFESNTAVSIYRLLNVVIYIIDIVLLSCVHNLRINNNSIVPGVVWLTMFIWLPFQDSFSLGQINEIILLCLIIAYWGWINNRDIVAGLGIGLAAAIKINPILLVFLYIFSRRWLAALVAILVSSVSIIASCSMIGVNQCVAFATTIFPNISRGSADYYHIGLNGLWYRLLTMGNTEYWTNLHPPPDSILIRIIPMILLVSFITVGYMVSRRTRHIQEEKSALFVLWIAGLLLSAPITWWHYSIWLLIGIPLLIEFASRSHSRTRLGTALTIILINLSPYVLLAIGLMLGSYSIAYLLLLLPCCGLISLTICFYRLSNRNYS